MGTVKSRINRGRAKLQGMLKEIYPFDLPETQEDEEMYSSY